MTHITANTLIEKFEQFAPKSLAMGKDPIGLHFGNLNKQIDKMMITLDVRPEVVEEAIDKNVDFIFSHHPPIFNAIKSFDTTEPQIKMYENIIKNDLIVYAAHTNLDIANEGMNDWLAAALSLKNLEILTITHEDESDKFGLGRVGELDKSMPLELFFDKVKDAYQINHFRYIADDLKQSVKKVAIVGGDGGDQYVDALQKGADLFITGDVYYHTAHDMQAAGLSVIDPGHHIESIVKPQLQKKFTEWAHENDWEINILQSEINTDPFQFI